MKQKVRYERNLQKRYMVIENCSQRLIESYAGQITQRRAIKGLLSCEIKRMDGMFEAWYDIGSCQILEQVYGVKEISYRNLKQLIVQLLFLFRELERYLVDISQVCFLPELVFCDRDREQICFLFDYREETEKGNVHKLAEFIIERTCHEEEQAVKLAYFFYECASGDFFDMEKLENYVEEIRDEKKEFLAAAEVEKVPEKMPDFEKMEKASIFRKIYRKIFQKKKEENVFRTKEISVTDSFPEQKQLPEPKQPDEDSDGNTIYVGKSFIDRKYSLVAVRHGKEEIHSITGYPYFIGKEKERVNFCIRDRCVSRIHARILEEAGKIFLEDLHSTNGTYVNDLPLIPHDKIEIKRGDILQFGNSEFTFR